MSWERKKKKRKKHAKRTRNGIIKSVSDGGRFIICSVRQGGSFDRLSGEREEVEGRRCIGGSGEQSLIYRAYIMMGKRNI